MSSSGPNKSREAPATAAERVRRRESGDRSFGDRAARAPRKPGPGTADDQDVVVRETYDATTEASRTSTPPRKPRNTDQHDDAPGQERPDAGSTPRRRR
ncbi:hypothetical protein SAMN05216371_8043 [Streptomyces sp. TLI_053]|uniref:hypothetical protein n=1 Tax=Streptomyces sp. TLI_053 TaxID=1855352 RepID=UPI00087A9D22|nr:hypothetical protein [Streptomyces sp. TLI_053]SDT83228.1 hypothetical protein SAMN05216371_8043 [Streptomyces sp. TLI_053]